jgi:twinkle protein
MSRKLPDSEFMQLGDLDINTRVEQMANIFPPSEFTSRLNDLYANGRNKGSFVPFWDAMGDKFVIRPKELTIVFGSRGSYKSTVVNYLIADWIMRGSGPAGLVSYEMEPEDLLLLLIEQLANSVSPSESFKSRVMDAVESKLMMVDEMVDSPHSAIAKVNAMLESGCKLVVMDCLQRVNMPDNNINLEREFVVEITNLVRRHNAHCIVVHHSRKGSHSDGDNPMPVVDDLKGSGGLADNAHNVMAVWSNKQKKDLMFKVSSGYKPSEDESEVLDMPDLILDVKKQRKGQFEGRIGLWRTDARAFHRKGARLNTL